MNVLFIIFNRPEATARVFEQIRRARPEMLFIAADGPRKNRQEEGKLCQKTRDVVATIDWPCEVKTRFQDKNLGCKIHVSSAITWFFDNIEEGIILEDDCLPVPSFFKFCTDLLERYRSTENVMHISGTNFLKESELTHPELDYRFSACVHVWGWATWRRAWKKYDIHMSHIDALAASINVQKIFMKKKYFRFWIRHCKHVGKKNIDTWDAQWQYSILYNNSCAVSPNSNIVENIGFGTDATHTSSKDSYILPVGEIHDPLRNPSAISIDTTADKNLMEKIYMRSFWQKIASKANIRLLKKNYEITTQ